MTNPVIVERNNNGNFMGNFSRASIFILLSLIFFVIDALLQGGVISGHNLSWLLPAGLASYMVSLLV
jgi:hypothetical protein